MFAHIFPAVENVPKFGTLVFGVPLTKLVAVRKNAFLGAGFLLVAACSAYASVKFVFLNSIE